MNKISEAILKTIIYGDIFDYPLTSEELQRFLICDNLQHERHPELVSGSDQMLKKFQHDDYIETDGEYFFLKNRKKIVELRKKREKWSKEKLKIAQKTARWLSFIPWIRMVGVTGSLAMNNSDRNDDIDFLIVSRTHRLWLTRLLATILMELLGKRRRPGMCHPERSEGSQRDSSLALRMTTKDKICLNMYLDEEHLAVPIQEQDLFTAHEVVQVKLLWERGEIYNKFLTDNLWVRDFLLNAINHVIPAKAGIQTNREKPGSPIRSGMRRFLNLFEKMAKAFQLRYMKSRRTTEVISDGVIRFHPQDARKWVLTRYQDSLRIALIKKE